jgi:transcriptional regulator of acetoin/glycerol metabolism
MSLTMRDGHRHADRILELVRGGFREQANDVVAKSWSRCLNEYQLHPDKRLEPSFVDRIELEQRRARQADVIACARYEMTTLFQQLADVESAVVLTDTDGVIVHMVSSPEFAPRSARWACVSAACGARPLPAPTAWAPAWPPAGRCRCSATTTSSRSSPSSPARRCRCSTPRARSAAVLDVTSRSSLMQQHLLVLLGMTARMIENRLIDARYCNAHPLHFHSRPEFVYTLHEGKLAVGRRRPHPRRQPQRAVPAGHAVDGRHPLAAHRRPVPDLARGHAQRSTSASFHPVVTYRANAALRFFAVARRPAPDARAQARPAGAPRRTPH